MLQAAFYYKSVPISLLLLLAPPQSAISCMFMFKFLLIFVIYWRQNQSYPLWLASLYTKGRIMTGQLWLSYMQNPFTDPEKHTPASASPICCLIPKFCCQLCLVREKFCSLDFPPSHYLLAVSLSLVSIDRSLSKGQLSFLWGVSIPMALRKPSLSLCSFIGIFNIYSTGKYLIKKIELTEGKYLLSWPCGDHLFSALDTEPNLMKFF